MFAELEPVYAIIRKLDVLSRTDPRAGCVNRAQFIASVFAAYGYQVGRAWILPQYERDNFVAPLYDENRKPIPSQFNTKKQTKWRYHCAAYLPNVKGKPVLDFPLFENPIALRKWRSAVAICEVDDVRMVALPFDKIPNRQILLSNPRSELQRKILPPFMLLQKELLSRYHISPIQLCALDSRAMKKKAKRSF